MTRTDAVIGLDIGTTTSKALIRSLGRARDEAQVCVVERATPWRTTTTTGTEIAPSALLEVALEVIAAAVHEAESAWGAVGVRALSVTGLAESGVILEPDGRHERPAIAWFDRRGDAELRDAARRMPPVHEAFPAVTGLPWSFQASLAKLLWWTASTPIAPGSTWLSVPEWIVHALGGERVREASLASRTGLVRQRTGTPWDDAFALARLPEGFLPAAVPAGTAVGKLDCPRLPSAVTGALLSVAGHDHPVAALAVGAVGHDDLFNSAGTADVLARAVAAPLTDAQRQAIVAAGWSAGAHVVPETELLLAGGSGGLLLRRVLGALGADTAAARETLDATSLQVTDPPAGLVVRGDGRDQQDVEIRLRDDATPAAIWAAATAYTASLSAGMLHDIEPVVGPHTRTVAAGGWTRMHSVQRAKRAAIGPVEFAAISQPGATGAALLAEHSLTSGTRSLPEFLCDLEPLRRDRLDA